MTAASARLAPPVGFNRPSLPSRMPCSTAQATAWLAQGETVSASEKEESPPLWEGSPAYR